MGGGRSKIPPEQLSSLVTLHQDLTPWESNLSTSLCSCLKKLRTGSGLMRRLQVGLVPIDLNLQKH